ncbi:MAG: glycosyltransferase [Desertimonas sp.]
MGRVLFVTWHGGGNVNPVVAIGQQLRTLGHDVRVLAPYSLTTRFERAGLPFQAFDTSAQWDSAALADIVADELDHLTSIGEAPALAVVDYMLPGALCATEAAGQRTVALVHTLYASLLADGTPGPMGIAATVDEINALRRHLGLDPVDRLGALLDRTERIMVVVPEEVDAPHERSPRVAYVGPVFEPAGDDAGWTPPPGDGPLVVVSLGTTDMDEIPVLNRVLGALAHERARVVATVGDHIDLFDLATPANAQVTRFVQHAAILPHADLVISHGGIGTALASMAYGVPVLFLPLGRDQPANATAIAALGAARVLSSTAGAGQIARAVEELLATPDFAAAARRVGDLIPRSGERHPATTLLAAMIDRSPDA